MRSIAVAVIVVSVSMAVVDMAHGQQRAGVQPGHGHTAGPVRHRQPTVAEVTGADQPKSEESAKVTDQENERLDRLIRGICRGC